MSPNEGIRYFQGAVAVVTGAASGIGKALSLALADQGANVVLCDLQEDLLAEVYDESIKRGREPLQICVDVRDPESVKGALHQALDQYGRLDLVFNNAGIVVEGTIEQHSIEDWNQIIDINLKGVVHGVHNAYPIMKNQGFGHIVNTASLAGLIPVPKVIGYTATKHAVVGLTRVIRIEGAKYGIRATAVCPGQVRTPILQGGKFGRVSNTEPGTEPSRALLEPDELTAKILQQVKRNKRLIVEPLSAKRVTIVNRLLPDLYEKIAQKL